MGDSLSVRTDLREEFNRRTSIDESEMLTAVGPDRRRRPRGQRSGVRTDGGQVEPRGEQPQQPQNRQPGVRRPPGPGGGVVVNTTGTSVELSRTEVVAALVGVVGSAALLGSLIFGG